MVVNQSGASMAMVLLLLLLAADELFADPRAQLVGTICERSLVDNDSTNNFVSTMEFVSMHVHDTGFGMAGPGPAGVDYGFGLAQCYGDLNSSDCNLCYAEARITLPRCLGTTGGRVYLDGCFARFSNYSFFSEYSGLDDRVVCQNTTHSVLAFPGTAERAIAQAVHDAPNNNGYSWAHMAVPGTSNSNLSVYVLANCWRTLNATACGRCLQNASASISRCFPSSEGRALNTGCFLRYSDTFFINPAAAQNGSSHSSGRNTVIILAAVGAAVILIVVAVTIVYMQKKRRSRKDTQETFQDERKGTFNIFSIFNRRNFAVFRAQNMDIELFLKNNENLAPKRYRYSDLKKITNSFSDRLGMGGFGSVYKGKLQDCRLVAVKLLNDIKGNGEEFMNEVASISRTSHINIVNLVGFCYESSRRALIYEFMPNGSLEKFLNCNASTTTEGGLGLEKLFEITVGIAQGLEYLHQGCNTRILHLDIKPHNILLDKDLRPKISDFGLAKLCPDRASIISMLGARGTVGYIAPEFCFRNFGGVSHKSDVYSFGMLVLEMVGGTTKQTYSGAVSTNDVYFPDWIYKQLEVNAEEAIDDIEEEDECQHVRRRLTIIGLWCIQTDPNQRPSISRVVEMLEGELETLHIPPKPHLFSPAKVEASTFLSTL